MGMSETHTLTIPATDQYGHISGKELGKLFMRQVNGLRDHEIPDILAAVKHDHRTLQQSAVGIALRIVLQAGQQFRDGDYDGRDEYSKMLCESVLSLFEQREAENLPSMRPTDRMPLV